MNYKETNLFKDLKLYEIIKMFTSNLTERQRIVFYSKTAFLGNKTAILGKYKRTNSELAKELNVGSGYIGNVYKTACDKIYKNMKFRGSKNDNVKESELSVRAINALLNSKIKRFSQLKNISRKELLSNKNLGLNTLNEIENEMLNRNIWFRQDGKVCKSCEPLLRKLIGGRYGL